MTKQIQNSNENDLQLKDVHNQDLFHDLSKNAVSSLASQLKSPFNFIVDSFQQIWNWIFLSHNNKNSTFTDKSLIDPNDLLSKEKIDYLSQRLARVKQAAFKLQRSLSYKETSWVKMGLELHYEEIEKLNSEWSSGNLTENSLHETAKEIIYFCQEINKAVLELNYQIETPNDNLYLCKKINKVDQGLNEQDINTMPTNNFAAISNCMRFFAKNNTSALLLSQTDNMMQLTNNTLFTTSYVNIPQINFNNTLQLGN